MRSPGALPRQPTSFCGRERELSAIREAFAGGARLVVLLGPGGVGKTRLACRYGEEVAAEVEGQEGWVRFCDLTEARSGADVVAAVARSLALALAPAASTEDALQQIGHYLAERGESLLIVDNFEQVVAEGAKLMARLTEAAPRARFLVTSRERLRLRGEVVLDVPPLEVPPEGAGEAALGYEAVQLFWERARMIRPALAGADAATVARIVRRLEGFPLAIELCATRCRALDPASLLERLEQSFDVLGRGPRDAAPRHESLARAIDWSFELCSPSERAALAQCAVFHGSFTLASAEAVLDLSALEGAPAVLDVLESLVDKSLVAAQPGEPTSRYALYLAIRERASRTLADEGGEEAAARRHARHYIELGEALLRGAVGPGGASARQMLERERENLLAAHRRALAAARARSGEGDGDGADDGDGKGRPADDALRAALVLDEILSSRGPLDAHLALLEETVDAGARAGADPRLLARALEARGRSRRAAGRVAEAKGDLDQALALALAAADREAEARVRASLCVLLRGARRFEEARAEGERARAICREASAPRFEVFSLGALGAIDLEEGHLDRAMEQFERVAHLSRELGDGLSEALAVAFQGHALQELGELSRARATFARAVAMFRELGDARYEAVFSGYLAGVEHELGDAAGASAGYAAAAARLAALSLPRFEGLFRAALGAALAESGRLDEARAAFGEAASELAQAGDPALLLALDIHKLHLLVAEDPEGGAARARRERDERALPSPLLALSDDARAALRLLDRALERASPAAPQPPAALAEGTNAPQAPPPLDSDGLLVGPDARWFQPPGGERVALDRRRALRLVLQALVTARVEAPGSALDASALLARGWPGERVLPAAGAHRVRVAIATLRRSGLRRLIQSRDDGYLLDPEAPVRLAPR